MVSSVDVASVDVEAGEPGRGGDNQGRTGAEQDCEFVTWRPALNWSAPIDHQNSEVHMSPWIQSTTGASEETT